MFLPCVVALWQSNWTPPYENLSEPVQIESYIRKLNEKKFGFYVDSDLLTIIAKGSVNPLQMPDWFRAPFVQNASLGVWVSQSRMKTWNQAFFNYTIKDPKGAKIATFRGPKAPKAPLSVTRLKGTVTDYTLDSKDLGMERKVTVYIPELPPQEMPVVFMADGQSCQQFANILEPLILSKKVRPTAIVGIHHGPYVGSKEKFEFEKDYRMMEYLKVASPERFAAHLSFVCNQVIPWARQKFKLSNKKEDTAIFGFSNGGAFAMTAAIDRPDVFGYALPHSVAAISREELEKADVSKLTTRFYFTAGTLETFINNTEFSFQTLTKKRVACEMAPYVSGHDSGMWQAGFAETIQRIFPLNQSTDKKLAWQRWMAGRQLNAEMKWGEAVAALEESYKVYSFTEPHFYQPAVLALAKSGNLDGAFSYVEKMAGLGWINTASLETDEKYNSVTSDPRWKQVKDNAQAKAIAMADSQDPKNLGLSESSLEERARKVIASSHIRDSELSRRLKKLGGFTQPKQTGLWVKYINHYKHFDGSLWEQPYFVHIPKSYKAGQRTPLMIFSNGGWFGAKQFRNILDKEFQFDNPPFEWMEKQGFIQVYPYGNQATATYQLNGLENYQQILRAVKNEFNIDDNRISLMGYSDGGTGAYRAACLQPSPYASFAPLNGYVYTTNAVSNYKNRPIFSLSADQDSLFPVSEMTRYHQFAESASTKWEQTLVFGNGHSYWPFIKDYMPSLTSKIAQARRNPLANYVRWEASHQVVGEIDWLKLGTIDTSLTRKPWHSEFRFIEKGDDGKDEEALMNSNTGMVEASYKNNVFNLRTSRVKEVTLLIDPDMVDLGKDVKVDIDGRTLFQGQVQANRKIISDGFLQNLDRGRIWVAEISVRI